MGKRDLSKPPKDAADRKDWLDDCIEQALESGIAETVEEAEDYCMSLSASCPVTKARAGKQPGNFEYILSDETPDRYGDIIRAEGMLTENFKRNPSPLF